MPSHSTKESAHSLSRGPYSQRCHAGPLPPPRTDNNGRSNWPEDDFDEEEGDMYEAPPCERAAIKVPTDPVDLDFIYLDRSTDQVAPQRQAAPPPRQPVQPQRRSAPPQRPPRQAALPHRQASPPHRQASPPQRHIPPPHRQAVAPPRPSKPTGSGKGLPPQWEDGPSIKKPPEVDRKEKPGKNSTRSPGHRLSALPAQTEEDVYIDPNEEQGDDVYLQPTAACPPSSRVPWRLPPVVVPSGPPPAAMMKPPVPRATNNPLTPPVSEMKAAPESTWPAVPPPRPVKPLVLARKKDPQHRAPSPPALSQMPGDELQDNEWFAGDCSRKHAEDLLLNINKDGAFLIRSSSSQDPRQPYTLAVLYRQKVYNIPIRFVLEREGYALGKVGKEFEDTFHSVQDIIVHHKNNQLCLIDSKSQAMHKTYLVHPGGPKP